MALHTPLLLQDSCMIHVLLRVEDFPIQSLTLLSHTIRRRIFFGLSKVDILHLGDSFKPMVSADVAVTTRIIDARQYLLNIVFGGFAACPGLSLNLRSALLEQYDDDIYSHISECYPSLEPTHINGFLIPKRSLPFLKLQSNDTMLRSSMVCPLLHYCNMYSAPAKLKIDINDFQSTVIWTKFVKYMIGIENDTLVSAISNPKIYVVIPYIQEFLSSVEVLELGTYATQYNQYDRDCDQEDILIILYVLLYSILTSSRPRLKHIKVFGIPDTIEQVMSTVVELLHATCTTPSKSIFHQYTDLEPLSLPTTPYILEGISVMPYEYYTQGHYSEFTTPSCASSISHNLMSVLEVHQQKLKSVAINELGYCCDLERTSIDERDGCVTRGKFNINIPEYRKFLMLLVEFIKQPQFTELTVVKSPLPEGFELIIAFLCTPAASHEQTLTIEASSQRSVEEVEDNEKEDDDDDDEENWIVYMDEIENQKKKTDSLYETPPKKKYKSDHSSMKPPCFPSEPLPLANAQYKCLDLGQSSDCVYSWLFHQLPELKLKSLKMRTLDMTIVPADTVIQIEHVAFNLGGFSTSDKPAVSPALLEKFVISNPVLKRLEFENDWDEKNIESCLPALNHCLLKLDQQGRGPEELILTFIRLDKLDENHLREFFVRVRDLSQHYGTVLVLSLYWFYKIANGEFFTSLSKEFQAKKIKKIVCYTPDVDPTPQLELVAEVVNVTHCEPPDIYYW